MLVACRWLRVAVLAAVASAVLAASSLASDIAFDEGDEVTWTTSNLTFLSEGGFINPEIECQVTLSGTIGTDPVAATSAHIGSITGLQAERPCSEGTISAPALESGNTWSIVSAGTTGSFPNGLTGLEVSVQGVQFTLGGLADCNYHGTIDARFEMNGPEEGEGLYEVPALTTDQELTLDSTTGSDFLCPPNGGLSATLAMAPEQKAIANPAAAQIQVTGSPLTIGRDELNGTFRTRNVGDVTARPSYTTTMRNGTVFAVNAPGCGKLKKNQSCTWTVVPQGRPAEGQIRIRYEEGFGAERDAVVSVIIQN